jgi:biopolymer transport protein ExbB/TolQ
MKNIELSSKLINFLISALAGLLFFEIMSLFAFKTIGMGGLHWFFHVLGGGEGGIVTLKIIMYIAFMFGSIELWAKYQKLQYETNGLDQQSILPTQDQQVLSHGDVEEIKLQVIRLQGTNTRFVFLDFIKKAATQFRNNLNISDTMQVLEGEFSATQHRHEGELETVRYIASTIPMLGFVGTIVELTSALQKLGDGTPNDLKNVREAMSGAFDATVLALVLTMFLTFYYHRYIGALDIFFGKVKSFILENLISRIYQKQR